MKFSTFEAVIEPDQEVYYSGQTVFGRVTATVKEPFKCRDVKIYCKGKAKVEWSESSGKSTKYYDATEKYFDMAVTVWTGGDDVKIPQGDYVWPFQFLLPPNIPSSFEGSKGYIRYKIQAVADIPMGFDDEAVTFFSVNVIDDLNTNELALKPLTLKKTDTTCCWCCTKGPVQLNFACKRSGAVIGENFKIRGEISNEGSKTIEETVIVLQQKTKYYADGEEKNSYHEVGRIKRGAIEPGESEFFDDVPFKIEAVVPNLKNCRIIDVIYRFNISASFGVCAGVEDRADFIIGTVPFMLEGAQIGGPIPVSTNVVPPAYANGDYSGALPDKVGFSDTNAQLDTDKASGMIPMGQFPPAQPPMGQYIPVQPPMGQYPSVQPPMGQYPTDPSAQPPMGQYPSDPSAQPPMGQYPTDPSAQPAMGQNPADPSVQAPMGQNPADPSVPSPNAPYPPNPFGMKGPPTIETSYFCREDRSRIDSLSPPPKYLSYVGVLD